MTQLRVDFPLRDAVSVCRGSYLFSSSKPFTANSFPAPLDVRDYKLAPENRLTKLRGHFGGAGHLQLRA